MLPIRAPSNVGFNSLDSLVFDFLIGNAPFSVAFVADLVHNVEVVQNFSNALRLAFWTCAWHFGQILTSAIGILTGGVGGADEVGVVSIQSSISAPLQAGCEQAFITRMLGKGEPRSSGLPCHLSQSTIKREL